MQRPSPDPAPLRIGAWFVNPASSQISKDGESSRVEIRTMRLLLCLAQRPGEVVSIDDLLTHVWSDIIVSPDSVYQAVASLRRLLGDDPKQPAYIETVPRLGYRMIATVTPWNELSSAQPASSQSPGGREHPATSAIDAPSHAGPRPTSRVAWAAGVTFSLALVVAFLLHGQFANHSQPASAAAAPQPPKSIAVLPFLDLTEGMNQEPFADGITEELIDKLSKIPGLQVPPPTSSFYFKGKQIPVAQIANSLGVAYVLDGSVRKSGPRLRVAARLIRADNGFVVWSDSYDRPFGDLLLIQDEIAGKVAQALQSSIAPAPDQKP
jgi:transcriptional activator of cad operon